MEQYFARRPGAPSRPRTVQARLRGKVWTFVTDRGVFAGAGIDPGTRALIEAMRIEPADQILDLGCGYGPIGLIAAHLASNGRAVLVDVNERAVALASENARRHHLTNVEVLAGDGTAPVRGRTFDAVVTNPPIRAGKAVLRRLLDEIGGVLRPGGRLYLVARTAQGAKTLAGEIEARVGPVREIAQQSGYRVYEAVRDV
ncbi:MAG TPA: methyltransferase [bacterium]|nr:methyltransferase [bacterium]